MTTAGTTTIDRSEAAARIAYRASEVVAIYPITPPSPMRELADDVMPAVFAGALRRSLPRRGLAVDGLDLVGAVEHELDAPDGAGSARSPAAAAG